MVTHQPAYNITDRVDRRINGGLPLTITAGVRATKGPCQVFEAYYHTFPNEKGGGDFLMCLDLFYFTVIKAGNDYNLSRLNSG